MTGGLCATILVVEGLVLDDPCRAVEAINQQADGGMPGRGVVEVNHQHSANLAAGTQYPLVGLLNDVGRGLALRDLGDGRRHDRSLAHLAKRDVRLHYPLAGGIDSHRARVVDVP